VAFYFKSLLEFQKAFIGFCYYIHKDRTATNPKLDNNRHSHVCILVAARTAQQKGVQGPVLLWCVTLKLLTSVLAEVIDGTAGNHKPRLTLEEG